MLCHLNNALGNLTICRKGSLIPRLFPPPVFDRLQYANMEGEGLGDLFTCVFVEGSTHGGRCPMKSLETLSYTVSLRAGGQSISKAASIPFIVDNSRDVSTQKGNYCYQAMPPVCLPFVYLMPPHVTRSPWSSTSVFAYCKQSNTGGGNGLGMRL